MDLRKLKTLIDLVAESALLSWKSPKAKAKSRSSNQPRKRVPLATHSDRRDDADTSHRTVCARARRGEPRGSSRNGTGCRTGCHRLASPMVGTFYRSSSPGGAPFVSIGDSVSEGQTLCVIEAMKLMNEIPADKAGVIKEILVENGQPVEFGQALFVIG